MSLYESKTRITYYDLDFRGKIKLSALLRMVHIAADVNANQLGIGFSVLHPLNISFILQRFSVSITRMPAYDEDVTIRTWPASIARGTFIRKGDMIDASGEKVMEWASLWILFDIAARKILKPSALPAAFESLGDLGVTTEPQKIDLPKDFDFGKPISSYIHTVRYSEVDTNMHMNNSIYGDLVGNAMHLVQENAHSQDWKSVHINYQGETRLDEQIDISNYKLNDSNLIIGQAPGRTSFTAKINEATSENPS